MILSCAIVMPALATAVRAQDDSVALEGPAYIAADEAYSSFKESDFRRAAEKAREAISARPEVLRLRLLLIDSLIASAQLTQAEQETLRAAETFSQNTDLQTRLKNIRDQLALGSAGDGYKALASGNAKAAISAAQQAAQYAPGNISYRLLLLNAQLAASSLTEALSTANAAVAMDRTDYVPLVWRGYLNQRLGKRQAAVADFNAALALPDISEASAKNIRLIAADAALAAGNFSSAIELLKLYPRTDPSAVIRLGDAEAVLTQKGTLRDDVKTPLPPVQNCEFVAAKVICTLQAPVVQSHMLPAPDNATLEFEAAGRAYQAERQKDYATAITEARKAIEFDPENATHRLLLVNLLMSAGRPGDAETEASAAIKRGMQSAELFAQRGYARNRLKNYEGAIADWRIAIQRGLPNEQTLNVKLSLVDAALAAKQPAMALSVLRGLGAGYNTSIRRAYALEALGQKEEALAAFSVAARLAPGDLQRDAALRSQMTLLVQLNRQNEARTLLNDAISRRQLKTVKPADLGYLASQVGDDQLAIASFDRARQENTLPALAHFDAGFAAKRNLENQKAIAYLTRGIDLWSESRFEFDPQQLYGVRRQLADLTREWGINTSVTYGKAGAAPNPFALPSSSYTSQVGSEIYYRPQPFGYQNGAIFEVFARVFDTLYDQSGGSTGAQSLQGMVGARWKPFTDQNFVLEVDKLFRLGNAARDDTLLRAAYSYTYGTDLRVDTDSWFTAVFYSEADHFFERTQNILQADARAGQSFRLASINSNLVIFPHAVVAASYDDSFAKRDAYSVGLGASLRYWFGETKYVAPPSYLELTAQYRFRIAGDSRAEGMFAQATVNY